MLGFGLKQVKLQKIRNICTGSLSNSTFVKRKSEEINFLTILEHIAVEATDKPLRSCKKIYIEDRRQRMASCVWMRMYTFNTRLHPWQ